MGVVYRATQLGLDRVVALKLITAELAGDAAFRSRFESEAQLAASIDHPNVVPVYGAGEADGVLFLAMRFVEGTDLRALVAAEGGLGAEHAVGIVWQVAGALDAAHRRGLVHRDVKPAERADRLEGEEHAYLTDFGLTKHAAAVSGFTRTGVFVGTPDFAAPEQIRGERADARADVYALGAVLFHALTGQVPFPATRAGEDVRAPQRPVPSATALAPGTPVGLDVVVATAMAKDPDARHDSAGDLARAAWSALQGDVAPALMGTVATGEAAAHAPVADTPPPSGASRAPSAAGAQSSPSVVPEALSSAGAHSPAGPAGWPRGRRIALLAAVPCLLAAALGVVAFAGFGGDDDPAAARPPQVSVTPTVTPDGPDGPRVVSTIPVGDGPDGITADGRDVFVSHARAGTLQRIDADRDALAGKPVKVGRSPDQIAAGKGTVWVVDAGGDELQRLQSDPELQPTARIPVGKDAQGISLGLQLAWVANTGDDTVQRVDRATATRVGDPIGVGDHPIGIFVGSKVWVTNFRDGTLTRIDTTTAQVEGDPLPTGGGARGVTESFGSVWVSNLKDDTVVRVDPDTFRVIKTIRVGREPKELVPAFGSIWVVNSGSNTVTRIDPGTNRVDGAPIAVGRDPLGITKTAEALWVTNFGDDTVSAIRP